FLIAPTDAPPTLVRPADRTLREGDTLRVQLQAAVPGGGSVRYRSDLLPGGATLEPETGVFTWTPTFFQAGVYQVPFTAFSGRGTSTVTTTFIVLNVNAAPRFEGLD